MHASSVDKDYRGCQFGSVAAGDFQEEKIRRRRVVHQARRVFQIEAQRNGDEENVR